MIVFAQKDVTVNDTVNAILALIKQNPSICGECGASVQEVTK